MRKTFFLIICLIISLNVSAATCPQFQSVYDSCHSRSMIEAFQVSRVDVTDTMPVFEFIIKARYETKHLKFEANGLPEEVSVPASYVQVAHCLGDRIHLIIKNEEEFGKESYEFIPGSEKLTIKTYLNSALINEVVCKTTE